ncbi:MAG: hypothetical protein ACI8RD_006732 [Bacillariaceae sp.]|jgi:hypothetical protein
MPCKFRLLFLFPFSLRLLTTIFPYSGERTASHLCSLLYDMLLIDCRSMLTRRVEESKSRERQRVENRLHTHKNIENKNTTLTKIITTWDAFM